VPPAVKAERNRLLLEDQDRRGMELHEPLIGRAVEVLAEGASLKRERAWSGRTRTNKITFFDNPGSVAIGDTVRVIVRRVLPQTLYGEFERKDS
jgi:tRNA A37 methylthiotransferase MiaB